MNTPKYHFLLLSGSIAIAIFSSSLAAQGFGQLKDLVGGSGAASSLGSLSSITSASTGNVAGIIEYCIKNDYLSSGKAASIKDQLMGKLSSKGDEPAQSNPDYLKGAEGILSGSDGQSMDLSEAGLKAAATKQICKKILDQAKSLL
jgi:uncharacterized protein DUF2501